MTRNENLLQKAKEVIVPILSSSSYSNQQDIIVFSHLRWNFVFQRPQQILTRLAKQRKILFIEEPITFNSSERGKASIYHPEKNITVMQPKIAFKNLTQDLPLLIAKQIRSEKLHDPVLWFYSAAFSEIIPFLNHSLIVYDCMDELAAFKGASPLLVAQEKYLLSVADIVFTGGKSLYEEKKKHAGNIYCFPSSVDQKHFARAYKDETILPKDIKNISQPTVGFYGVIDERLDKNLLEQIARRMPQVAFVMIGPIIKIDPKSLPKLPNIHYLGPKPYHLLPAYLKGIHIAMMPFALNDATKFISPTKTLEFIAAGKPIVSTPITDVIRDYKDVIQIAHDPNFFVKSILYYLQEGSLLREIRERAYKIILKQNSWDTVVSQMQKIMQDVCDAKAQTEQRFVATYYPLVPQLTTTK